MDRKLSQIYPVHTFTYHRFNIVCVRNDAHVGCVQYSEQMLRVSLVVNAHSVSVFFIKVLFASKVVKTIYVHLYVIIIICPCVL